MRKVDPDSDSGRALFRLSPAHPTDNSMHGVIGQGELLCRAQMPRILRAISCAVRNGLSW